MYVNCVYHLPGLGEVIMVPSVDPLAALAELERRFNGPVPEPLRLPAPLRSAPLWPPRPTQARPALPEGLLADRVRRIPPRPAAGRGSPPPRRDLRPSP